MTIILNQQLLNPRSLSPIIKYIHSLLCLEVDGRCFALPHEKVGLPQNRILLKGYKYKGDYDMGLAKGSLQGSYEGLL